MCTAITYRTKDHYFGRNLDIETSYGEKVVITPRNFSFVFRKMNKITSHYAIIGVATVKDNYPLYYDATNEKGLSMAGLNFPGNARYNQYQFGKDNVSPFEFIPGILGRCKNICEAKNLLKRINLIDINFSDELPLSPLHWIIADRDYSITVESVKDGLKIYDNPVGVLTNNPTFEIQMFNLNNYMSLSPYEPEKIFSADIDFDMYSRGMGAIGLPGDLSSMSRFVRASFVKINSVSNENEEESISQFFHILGSVCQQRGCVRLPDGKYEITTYSSCCNTDKGIFYYTTYENSQITGVDIFREKLDGAKLISYPLINRQQIKIQNLNPRV